MEGPGFTPGPEADDSADTGVRGAPPRGDAIEAELVAIALEHTGAEHGALFVWDKAAGGLALVHHVVERRHGHAAARACDRRRSRPASRCTSTTPTSRTCAPTPRAIRTTRAT